MNVDQIKIIFKQSIENYHILNNVNQDIKNPYKLNTLENLLYNKNWIDTVQWHLEDLIRNPSIKPITALKIKRKIDLLNQQRTDVVELIDEYFLNALKMVTIQENASINTESPAWAIDRLSILELKIYHMKEEVKRIDGSYEHKQNCSKKLEILILQNQDLSQAIEILFDELKNGLKYMKVYKQMKMYNDPNLNPVLYGKKS